MAERPVAVDGSRRRCTGGCSRRNRRRLLAGFACRHARAPAARSAAKASPRRRRSGPPGRTPRPELPYDVRRHEAAGDRTRDPAIRSRASLSSASSAAVGHSAPAPSSRHRQPGRHTALRSAAGTSNEVPYSVVVSRWRTRSGQDPEKAPSGRRGGPCRIRPSSPRPRGLSGGPDPRAPRTRWPQQPPGPSIAPRRLELLRPATAPLSGRRCVVADWKVPDRVSW